MEEIVNERKKVILTWIETAELLTTTLIKSNKKSQKNEELTKNIAIAQGISLVKQAGPSGANLLRSALYISVGASDLFACVDRSFAQIWHNDIRRAKKTIKNSIKGPISHIAGLTHLIFAPKWRILIAATSKSELQILDTNLVDHYSANCPGTITCISFFQDRLFVACIGKILIWSFKLVPGM